VPCDSELIVGAVVGVAGSRRDPERGRAVLGQQRSRRHDDESPSGRSRSVEREDGGDQRGRQAARQSHYLGQPVSRSPAAISRRTRCQVLRHRPADLHGSSDRSDRLLLSVRATGRLSASRRPANGRALHVQRAVRRRGRGRGFRGHGRVLSQLGRRAGALLHAHGEYRHVCTLRVAWRSNDAIR